MAYVLIAGLSQFNGDNFHLPPEPFGGKSTSTGAFILSLGAAMRFGVYDFTGYYDVCQMGGEV